MRKAICVLLVILAVFFSLPVILKPVILLTAKKQLKSVFKDSVVTVENCRLRSVSLAIYGIGIERKPFYKFSVEEIRFSYRFSTLFKGRIMRAALKGIKADINTPGKKAAEFTRLLNLNTAHPPPFTVACADILRADIKVRTQDLGLDCGVSLGIDLGNNTVHYLALRAASLDAGGAHFENISLGSALRVKAGSFYAGRLKFDKVKLEDIEGRIVLGSKGLALYPLCARLFGGKVCGSLALSLDREGQYALDLSASGIGLGVIVDDLKLAEKMRMTGKLEGTVSVKGAGLKLALINGDLSVAQPGGTLAITDEGLLKNLAAQTQQSLDMLVESFKDYQYDTGIVKLDLNGGDLILDAALNGKDGKRNLNITLHKFDLKDYLPE